MKQVDIGPRKHSHLYEIKPMSRWWLAVLIPYAALGIIINGPANPATWALLVAGFLIGMAWLLIFPRLNLTKRD